MIIAFIGIGQVGSALAGHLSRLGHTVIIGARDPQSSSVTQALAHFPSLHVETPAAAVAGADVVFLATPFAVNQAALAEAGDLTGKIVVDCTNPVGPNLSHGLNSEQSGSELIQSWIPTAKVVKAFTIYGFENFGDPTYPGDVKPAMLMAGDEASAKQVVADLCGQMGWDPVDTGGLGMSLHLEHMTLLWIKMARMQGWGSSFVWAMLRR